MKLTAALRNTERMAREIAERVSARLQAMAGRDVQTDRPWTLGAEAWPGAVSVRVVARPRARR